MLSVALIDDNPDDRTLIIRELKRALPKLQVTEIASQAQLDAMLQRGGYDIVITDYQLGWNDGLTIL
ncbi:MAG TPA: hypothetical protein VFX76_22085, partial [Roseiflexaceae bacterium]|nr:hypothetical protein [Roseiflexaceae bacterium]